MVSYIVVMSILFVLALIGIRYPNHQKRVNLLSTFLLTLFAGLRYQTGYDWPAYEANYKAMVGVKEALCYGLPSLPIISEPLFLIFNIFLKSLNFSTTAFFFTITVLNLTLIHFVVSKITKEVTLTWLPYFGFAFLIAQMTLIRQGIASSLVLLALYLASNRRHFWAFVFQLIAIGFQVSTVIFAPLLFLTNLRPSKTFTIFFLSAGIVFTALGISVHGYILNVIFELAPLWFDKVPYYINAVQSPLTFGSVGLIIFHIALLALLYNLSDTDEKKEPKIILSIWLTLLVLAGHLYAHGFPTIWNRIMIVSVPWQIAGLLRLKYFRNIGQFRYKIIATVLFGISLTSIAYTLSRPKALPFTPYSSIVDPWLGWEQVDGYARLRRVQELYGDPKSKGKTQLTDPGSFTELTAATAPERALFGPALNPFFDRYCNTPAPQ